MPLSHVNVLGNSILNQIASKLVSYLNSFEINVLLKDGDKKTLIEEFLNPKPVSNVNPSSLLNKYKKNVVKEKDEYAEKNNASRNEIERKFQEFCEDEMLYDEHDEKKVKEEIEKFSFVLRNKKYKDICDMNLNHLFDYYKALKDLSSEVSSNRIEDVVLIKDDGYSASDEDAYGNIIIEDSGAKVFKSFVNGDFNNSNYKNNLFKAILLSLCGKNDVERALCLLTLEKLLSMKRTQVDEYNARNAKMRDSIRSQSCSEEVAKNFSLSNLLVSRKRNGVSESDKAEIQNSFANWNENVSDLENKLVKVFNVIEIDRTVTLKRQIQEFSIIFSQAIKEIGDNSKKTNDAKLISGSESNPSIASSDSGYSGSPEDLFSFVGMGLTVSNGR
jgi:hypothetical protein